MRVALISDVHSNLDALEAVLTEIVAGGVDAIWSMGDQVGYGPDPDAVLRRLQFEGVDCLAGNHDAATIGRIDTADFNPIAAQAVSWTASRIQPASRAFLESLPPVLRDENADRVHGTLRDPTWEYLDSFEAARAHFALQQAPLSIVGHTHLPLAISLDERGRIDSQVPEPADSIDLAGKRWVLNPGSVGQPRDGDPRAAWALLDLDSGSFTVFRVPYDPVPVGARIVATGLPAVLAERLIGGR